MMSVEITKTELERGGTPCAACKTPLPATAFYAIRCPKCAQLYQVAPGQRPAPAQVQA